MNLTIKQTDAWYALTDNVTTEVLFGGGAGGGKSAFGCLWLIAMCYKYPETSWLMGRAKLKTLKETTLKSFFGVAKMQGLVSGVHYKYNQQSSVIRFDNGSEIIMKDLFLYPSDPEFDELGSLEITGAFIDECNQITEKAWTVVKSRIRYKLDENGLIPKMLGTCNPAKNWVYNRFYFPYIKNKLGEGLRFIQSLLTDNPHISKHYKENLLTLDESSKQRLLFGNWDYDDDPTILIDFESIQNSFTNDFVSEGTGYITADIARFGKDKTVIMVWSGFRMIEINTLNKSSIPDSVLAIKKLSTKYKIPLSNVIVDEDGVGGGVKDVLGCKGFINNSAPIVTKSANNELQKENYINLKSQCYYKLAERMNRNEYFLDIQDSGIKDFVSKELSWVKRHNFDNDGKLSVLPKEIIKEAIGRSPDFSDTIMMREYFELKPKFEFHVA